MVTVAYTNMHGILWLGRCSNTNAQRVLKGHSNWLPIEPATSRDSKDAALFNFPSGNMYESVSISVSRIIQINTI